MQCGAIESGWRIQACRIERRPHFEPAFQQKCGVLLRCIAPVRAPPSGQSVCGASLSLTPEKGREARLKARTKPGLLNKCLPLFRVSELALLYTAHGVNKRTSIDKGPAKISPRGPFRGNQHEFANSFFSVAGLAGLKESRLPPTLLFISSFIRMWRNCRIATYWSVNYFICMLH